MGFCRFHVSPAFGGDTMIRAYSKRSGSSLGLGFSRKWRIATRHLAIDPLEDRLVLSVDPAALAAYNAAVDSYDWTYLKL